MRDELKGPHITPPTEDLAPPPKCQRCGREDVSVDICCSSHKKELCNSCYNTSHFVEVGPDTPGYFIGARPS